MPQLGQPSSGTSPRPTQSIGSVSSTSSVSLSGVVSSSGLLVAPPRKSSQIVTSATSPAPASISSQGLSPSYSHTSVSNINKSLSTLDAQKISKDIAADSTIRGSAWQTLCVKVLPLFNGQGLKGHMEDMNELVSNWLTDTPAYLVVEELNDLLNTGMLTLGNKLATVANEVLASRLVEVWSFYFGTVVPYLQGVFLPVRTQWRNAAARTGDSPDVRKMALIAFRDQIIVPLGGRLTGIFPKLVADIENGRKINDTASRLMQMLCILDGIPVADDRASPIAEALVVFKETMMGTPGLNRNSIALFGARVHTST
ncbi:hypothetical protein SpCBS45565_g02995 [Spizellomyces sp. 'palustris']|nr:hypothetical protein SpCBS45565_g02995 [Spizellomyces sp. 'palustris']